MEGRREGASEATWLITGLLRWTICRQTGHCVRSSLIDWKLSLLSMCASTNALTW